ncbi:hypothetical protein BDF14DRAFT_1816453 [Spinellus fusiger]|nr:hypothetical protein BDF14DRAFT_1816453 [Spinellus fusiger]
MEIDKRVPKTKSNCDVKLAKRTVIFLTHTQGVTFKWGEGTFYFLIFCGALLSHTKHKQKNFVSFQMLNIVTLFSSFFAFVHYVC